MRLVRYHGLGNDYLVAEDLPALGPDRVRQLCDRHTGVGSDGVLEPFESDRADLGVRIWNPDGTVAEKSGNGLRIAAHWAVRAGRAGARHRLDTGFDVVGCVVEGDAVEVAMGRATTAPAAIPLDGGPLVDAPVDALGRAWALTALSVGNPHAVVFVEEPPDAVDWRALGAHLETHPRWPNRTNVQVARVEGAGRVALRIWERGAGPTQASGSSACAVVAAAVLTGRLPAGAVEAVAPGGTLTVTVTDALDLTLRGPVERVGVFDVDPAWWARRAGGA